MKVSLVHTKDGRFVDGDREHRRGICRWRRVESALEVLEIWTICQDLINRLIGMTTFDGASEPARQNFKRPIDRTDFSVVCRQHFDLVRVVPALPKLQ
jgi:hypothetical protein